MSKHIFKTIEHNKVKTIVEAIVLILAAIGLVLNIFYDMLIGKWLKDIIYTIFFIYLIWNATSQIRKLKIKNNEQA